jgi:hypothetical protein
MNDYGASALAQTEDGGNGGAKAGHFSRYRHLRRSNFASANEVAPHIDALRSEWERR